MTLVIDASVALKWVMDEEDSAQARLLLTGEALAAPDLMLLEAANVLALRVRRKVLTPDQAAAKLDALLVTLVREVPSRPHLRRAQALAMELGQSAYDSLYLAIALAEGAVFVTADGRFATAAKARYGHSVRML